MAALLLVRQRHVVNLMEVLASPLHAFVVLELASGGTLFQTIVDSPRGRLADDVAAGLMAQLVAGLEFCHRRGVCHRDLKPENVLIDANGTVKLSDFGLAAVLDAQQGCQLQTASACGTPHYAAPEVLGSGPVYDGFAADVWSCGVIFFVASAGFLRWPQISSCCSA